MKRIPFTIEAWKAGGVPVTRYEKFRITNLVNFDIDNNHRYAGIVNGSIHVLTEDSMMLEVPCTKYYTHYYRTWQGEYRAQFDQNPEFINNYPKCNTHIKTVEVEL